MNFKTTIVLLALLVVVGAVVFFTRDRGGGDTGGTSTEITGERKLIDLDAKDVTRLAITPANGPPIVFERKPSQAGTPAAAAGARNDWRMVQPMNAAAESFEVDTLVRELAELRSRGQIKAVDKTSVGLDSPAYTIELTGNNKTAKLTVGAKSAVGDTLYVQVDGKDRPDVVAGGIYERLDKPAGEYRSKRLVETPTTDIRQLAIERPNQPAIRLEKAGTDWQVTEPAAIPADADAVSSLTTALSTMSAEDFVKATGAAASPALYGLTNPQLTVTFNTAAPATQPATNPAATPATQPAGTVLRFGGYDDMRRKSVYLSVGSTASAGAPGMIVKVPATSMDAFKKQPLDLRDRKAAEVKADDVSEITLVVDRPSTTQPTTQAAEQRTLHIARRKENLELGPTFSAPGGAGANPATAPAAPGGPATAPATQPATTPSAAADYDAADLGGTFLTALAQDPAPAAAAPATQPASPATAAAPTTAPATQPTTQPATLPAAPTTEPTAEKPTSKWVIASEGGTAADDQQVTELLEALQPLRASKYLAQPPSATQPATQPSTATTYVLTVKTVGAGGANAATHEIRITDPGGTALPVVQYRDLVFEVERAFVRKLEGDFKTKRADASPIPPLPGGTPGGFPGGFPHGQ